MSEPIKYMPTEHTSGMAVMVESKNGFWVHERDYARLKAEVELLKSEPDALTAYLYADTLRRDEIKALKAHIERLCKAGNAMIDAIKECDGDDYSVWQVEKAVGYWRKVRNAAKEVQS